MIDWQRGIDDLVGLPLRCKPTGPSVRLWTISTELLVEAGPGQGTRSGGGMNHVAVAG